MTTAVASDEAEDDLLRAIYAAQLPSDKQKRLHALAQKLEAEDALATDEQREFQTLTEQAETLNAERIEKVAQLAALWGKPLTDVMKQLGLWRNDSM